MPLFACVRTQASFRVVNWLGGLRSDVWIVGFEVLHCDTLLEIVDAVPANPNLNLLLRVVGWERAEALWGEGLLVSWPPTLLAPTVALG